jgi:hypothetical protein
VKDVLDTRWNLFERPVDEILRRALREHALQPVEWPVSGLLQGLLQDRANGMSPAGPHGEATGADVNSRAFWDTRFASSWQADHGPEQTRFFCELALATLPQWLRQQVQQHRFSVCDWGCALGEGTALLARGLGTTVKGVDFSATAIEKAKAQYPGLEFLCEDWLAADVGDVYDLVFSSNTLEHFEQPWSVFRPPGAARALPRGAVAALS